MIQQQLCHKLKLSIDKRVDTMADEQVRITLEDSLNLTEVVICHSINVTTPKSRLYHIKEAMVIAMRQLIDQAIEQGMIKLTLGSPGVQTTLNIPRSMDQESGSGSPLTGSTTEPDA